MRWQVPGDPQTGDEETYRLAMEQMGDLISLSKMGWVCRKEGRLPMDDAMKELAETSRPRESLDMERY